MLYMSKNFRAQAGVLVSYALTNFKHANDNLKKHEQKDYHKEAVVKMQSFMKVMSGQHFCPDQQCATKLRSIVETIILCGRQNIPVGGHRDAGTDLERECESWKLFSSIFCLEIHS